MPTAVMTESSENTTSSATIWATIGQNATARVRDVPDRLRFEAIVDLHRRLHQQEKPAGDENEVAPGHAVAPHGEHRLRERHDPADAREQRQAHDQGEHQTDPPGALALARWQPAGENRDEDQVVDAEHDLERNERRETDPDRRIRHPFHLSFTT